MSESAGAEVISLRQFWLQTGGWSSRTTSSWALRLCFSAVSEATTSFVFSLHVDLSRLKECDRGSSGNSGLVSLEERRPYIVITGQAEVLKCSRSYIES